MAPTPNVTERFLYSRIDAARMLSISPRALSYLISEGRIPVRRIGGRVLLSPTALKEFSERDEQTRIVPVAK